MQPRERHIGLEFHSARRQDPHRSRLADSVLEQGGLADPRLPANQQARARAEPRRGQGLVDRKQLRLSAQQHRPSLSLPTTRWGPGCDP